MKVTRAKGHLSEAEIDQRISKIKDYWRVRRWLIIRHALVDGYARIKLSSAPE